MTPYKPTPSLQQLNLALSYAVAYGHAWGCCEEGHALVAAWNNAGEVPDDWDAQMHKAVLPTLGACGGITAPTVLFTTQPNAPATLSHSTTTGRLSWVIEDAQYGRGLTVRVTLHRPVGPVFADRYDAATDDAARADVIQALRNWRGHADGIACLTVTIGVGAGVFVDVLYDGFDAPLRDDHYHALALALVPVRANAASIAEELRQQGVEVDPHLAPGCEEALRTIARRRLAEACDTIANEAT